MKDQKGFSPISAILIVVIVGIIGFTGWYVYNATQNNNKTLDSVNDSTMVSTKPTATPKASPTPTPFDEKAESNAAKADVLAGQKCENYEEDANVIKVTSNGWAQVGYSCGGGAILIAQKINGTYKVLFGFQDGPYCSQLDQYKVSKQLFNQCYNSQREWVPNNNL